MPLTPDFPKEMRRKLRGGRVAVAGLGGLGSNIAVMLARSGVGKLLLVDFDVVDVDEPEPADVPDSTSWESRRRRHFRSRRLERSLGIRT